MHSKHDKEASAGRREAMEEQGDMFGSVHAHVHVQLWFTVEEEPDILFRRVQF